MLNWWRRLFGGRVFLSYREREDRDDALAKIIAAGLADHGFHPILEADKENHTRDRYRHLYQLLAGSEAVVSITSAPTKDSPWLFFEALTAKQQDKLHLVALGEFAISPTLREGDQEVLRGERFEDVASRATAIHDLVARIRETSKRARVYRSVPGLLLRARRLVATTLAIIVALMTFIVLFDNARKAVCAHQALSARCVAAGWPAASAE